MKTSSVSYPANEPIVLVRQTQVQICDGNFWAAALLNHFEYWHSIKMDQQEKNRQANDLAEKHGDQRSQDESLLCFFNERELESALLDGISRNTINKHLEILKIKGFITIHKNPNPRYWFDKTRYFLFHPEIVQQAVNSLYSDNPNLGYRRANSGLSSPNIGLSQPKNEACYARARVPDSGSETTSETTDEHGEQSKKPTAAASKTPLSSNIPSSDHQKLMKTLFDLTGPISDGKAQGAAIQWLLKNGYCVEDCEACLLDQLTNPDERWRSQVSWLTVRKCIGTYKAKQNIPVKGNINGKETTSQRNVRLLKENLQDIGLLPRTDNSPDNNAIPISSRLLSAGKG